MMYYRLGHEISEQGLWYDQNGNFTGLIHNEFNFCECNKLLMDYDPEIVGYISVADSIEHLLQWFPVKDIVELQKHGYKVDVYESEDVKFYEKFQHNVILQKTAKLIFSFKLLLNK